MIHSTAWYTWLTIVAEAETAEDQKLILAEAEAELSAAEYEALVKALEETGVLRR